MKFNQRSIIRYNDTDARHKTRKSITHERLFIVCRGNKLHLQMVLLSIIRSIASSKLDQINKRTN